jgi:putative DNA primase/helicase
MKTNPLPKITATDDGTWRRIHCIPYPIKIEEDEIQQRFREINLMPELPGILNWCLEGLRMYFDNGEKLKPPPIVCSANKEYQQQSDIAGRWINENYEPHKKEEIKTRKPLKADVRKLSYLYEQFQKWGEGEVGKVDVSRNDLAEAFRKRKFKVRKSHGVTAVAIDGEARTNMLKNDESVVDGDVVEDRETV